VCGYALARRARRIRPGRSCGASNLGRAAHDSKTRGDVTEPLRGTIWVEDSGWTETPLHPIISSVGVVSQHTPLPLAGEAGARSATGEGGVRKDEICFGCATLI